MKNDLPLLQVRLFGTERILYGKTPILFGRNSITKALKLLIILLYNGETGITRSRLIEDLYGREEMADVANNLRVTLHRLKKILVDAGLPEHEYIVSKDGRFYWDSPMETQLDVHIFRDLINNSDHESDPEKRFMMLRKACEMYSGEFLQKLSSDEWVIIEGVQYKNMYAYAMNEACQYLMEQKEYQQVIRLVEPACELYPFDEWQSLKIDALIAMNRYKDALKEYEATAQLLVEELGITPSQKMMKQFQLMSEHIKNRPQAISEIKNGLKEESEEKGAFYCTLPGFRDAYRVIRRGMERTGQSVFLLVCTLTDSKGRPMESSEKLNLMSDELYLAIKNSLRRSDTFTKYNASQYLVLLMGTNEENCQIVIDRITRNYSLEHKSWTDHLTCSVTSLYDMEPDTEKLYFESTES